MKNQLSVYSRASGKTSLKLQQSLQMHYQDFFLFFFCGKEELLPVEANEGKLSSPQR